MEGEDCAFGEYGKNLINYKVNRVDICGIYLFRETKKLNLAKVVQKHATVRTFARRTLLMLPKCRVKY